MPWAERATAASADLSSTSAVASLTSPSPSRIVSRRGGRPSRLPIEVAATTSVGLMTAPSASAAAKSRSGSSAYSTNPVSRALAMTSSTESPAIAVKLRRKSTIGTLIAAA